MTTTCSSFGSQPDRHARFDGGKCPKCYLTNQEPGTPCGSALFPAVVLEAVADGRFCRVVTYREGAAEKDMIRNSLLFHSAQDAQRCAKRLMGIE